jgi:hypothetical protein
MAGGYLGERLCRGHHPGDRGLRGKNVGDERGKEVRKGRYPQYFFILFDVYLEITVGVFKSQRLANGRPDGSA